MKGLRTIASILTVATTASIASVAYATVNFDLPTGTGFVGKGDVQLAYGWNNSQLQSNAKDVSFTYNVTNSYEATCTWTTGEGKKGEKTHNVNHTQKSGVNSTIAYDARVKNQITGFNLTGTGSSTTIGSIPEVGKACPGNEGHEGVWSSVTQTGSSGGLYVNYGGNEVKLQ